MRETAIDKWRTWIDRIQRDISASIQSRRCWRELVEMWDANRALRVDNETQDWIARIYAGSAALAVRRQLDKDRDSVSLHRLLSDLEGHAEFWTLDDHLGHMKPGFVRGVAAEHASAWLKAGAQHLDSAVPAADLVRLVNAGRTARHYSDRVVAHTDKRGLEGSVTYKDLHDALDAVELIALRYHTILTGGSYIDGSLLAKRQFNHETIHRRAWLRPRWKRASWPPETVERQGGLWPRLDTLAPADCVRLARNRRAIASELNRRWQRHEPHASPIRTVLEAMDLPACDAAVQWVRDYLLLRGPDWRRSAAKP